MPLDIERIDPRWVLYAIVTAAVLAAIAFGYLRWRRYASWRDLNRAIADAAYDMLTDVLVPDGMDGLLHVDFLLLTQRGILVLSLRDMPGMVFGGDQMNEWTVITRTRRYTFPNPQGPLLDRVAAVRALAGDAPVEGRVLFTSRSRFPKGRPKSVLILDSLELEYAPVEKATLQGVVDRFMPGWDNVKASAVPSDLKRY